MNWRQVCFFDKEDWELLQLVNTVVNTRSTEARTDNLLFDATLHPHGIKALASSREIRVAHAVVRLLDSLEAGLAKDRLQALRVLYDEVLNSAQTTFRRNTARVLLQVMKDLVRAHGDQCRQLMLAHDFRKAASGKPRIVRALLDRYHLVEMPEDWSQLSFDHHVHDANTKGRKNPTHLIMDAWIKGIRYLTIVYYNYVEDDAVREIMTAAETVGIHVRVGIEYAAPFHGRFVHFIWVPRGFSGVQDFLEFLSEPPTRHLMRLGKEVSDWQAEYVFMVLERWNTVHRHAVGSKLHTEIPPLELEEFTAFVGSGQASLQHLSECIFNRLAPMLREEAASIKAQWELCTDGACKQQMQLRLEKLANFGVNTVHETWLSPQANPDLPLRDVPSQHAPELLQLSPALLLDWLASTHSGSRITLNLSRLSSLDVLELLWQCQGLITHLELFNLKELFEGNLPHLEDINQLQRALNGGSAPRLKRIIRDMIKSLEEKAEQTEDEIHRCSVFREILRNIPMLQSFYEKRPLRARCGTDSTSRSQRSLGMGLVFVETLDARGKEFFKRGSGTMDLPLHINVSHHEIYHPMPQGDALEDIFTLLRSLPGCRHLGYERQQEWLSESATARIVPKGNISTLGGHLAGMREPAKLTGAVRKPKAPTLRYCNSRLVNMLKVLAGFIPAICAFQYTQTWWLLAYFGPVLWFMITGVRNIVQFVLAGKGLRHTTLLRWGDFVDWSRLCDSLMYTGFSVLLLELGMRYLLMERTLGLSAASDPMLVYSLLAAANGLYICSHNIFRGLPHSAAIGNLFRSALAIPVSIFYNAVLALGLGLLGMADAAGILTHGAAIISKCASDTVAAWIEGLADRQNNRRMRRWDIEGKLKQLFASYTKLELLFPEKDALAMLADPESLLASIRQSGSDLDKELIIHALDMMHFWLYQPRSQDVLRDAVHDMSYEERIILLRLQLVLSRERDVAQFFVNGLVGRNFARPLAFYLDEHSDYMQALARLCFPDGFKKESPAEASAGHNA
ncbi:MAG: hypothetical protein PHN64_01675 [Desulfovibrionaceae bacterium]|nr:hypothetical protein [Desulfovibrionaceae bacterium]